MSETDVVIKKALKRITELQQEIDRLNANASDDAIALVGIGCRFPGGADSVEKFWNLLVRGDNAIVDIPQARWTDDEFYAAGSRVAGKTYAKRGGIIDDIDCFDAALFGIASQEACSMDPQQRLLLETSWHAFEDANIPLKELRGKSVGTFLAMGEVDYSRWSYHSGVAADIGSYTKLGVSRAVGVGRINYLFDFRGPAVMLDTTCSSSLLAIHLAAQSLRSGECDWALAGGINLMLTPEDYIGFSALSALSPSDQCVPFDASADGYVRGEGCGTVVLKRLSDAKRDGDRIYCVLKGSACNHDGQSNGLTAPNGLAQENVIQQALKNAGLTVSDIGYVEAHGTGTKLGDPIEVAALARALQRDKQDAPLLAIGSVKGQIGHLESAAGVASFIKAALIQFNGYLPGCKHIRATNPLIRLDKSSIRIPAEGASWPLHSASSAIGVSAFGMSGTNVHIVIDTVKSVLSESPITHRSQSQDQPQLLVFSANNIDVLVQLAAAHAHHLSILVDGDFPDYCVASRRARDTQQYQVAIQANSRQQMIDRLAQVSLLYQVAEAKAGKPAFLFGGETIDWNTRDQYRAKKISLPLYPFAKTRFWVDGQWQPYSLIDKVLTQNDAQAINTFDSAARITDALLPSVSNHAEKQPEKNFAVSSAETALVKTRNLNDEVLAELWRMVDKEIWDDLDTQKNLQEFGLCSIGALECNQRILKRFKVDISALVILEQPVGKLAEHIISKIIVLQPTQAIEKISQQYSALVN